MIFQANTDSEKCRCGHEYTKSPYNRLGICRSCYRTAFVIEEPPAKPDARGLLQRMRGK